MSREEPQVSLSASPSHLFQEQEYSAFLGRLQARFEERTAREPLFTTDATGLWDTYLAALPEAQRQIHNCGCCRRFIERFGHLVTIDAKGHARSALWDEHLALPVNAEGVRRLREQVERARVDGVFLSSLPAWGTPEAGGWTHLSLRVPPERVFRSGLLDAHQRMAELREHFRCLNVALGEFQTELLKQAQVILKAEALTRSEKFIGVVEWLLARQRERSQGRGQNLLWKAVASAPAGFCTPRASMVGSLLEDLAAGLPFAVVKQKFDAKMHPLQYQRPQVDPTAGNVQQAEAAIAKLGLAPALERRFATLADVQLFWKPHESGASGPGTGVFSHLRTKGAAAKELLLPEKTLTWVKFRDTVLPTAEKMELRVPASSGAFSALVTAVHPEAPPLIQWDTLERRNPVSWYFYVDASSASDWSLRPGDVEVLGLTMKPNTWFDDRFAHQGQGVFFILQGAQDRRNKSLALFPEILRGDLHGVRATIESFSRSRQLAVPGGQPLASGMLATPGNNKTWDLRVRVTSRGAVSSYLLDRWD